MFNFSGCAYPSGLTGLTEQFSDGTPRAFGTGARPGVGQFYCFEERGNLLNYDGKK